jgi:hypothetical protein
MLAHTDEDDEQRMEESVGVMKLIKSGICSLAAGTVAYLAITVSIIAGGMWREPATTPWVLSCSAITVGPWVIGLALIIAAVIIEERK